MENRLCRLKRLVPGVLRWDFCYRFSGRIRHMRHVLFLLLAAGLTSGQVSEPSLGLARSAFQAGKLSEAEQALRGVLDKHPDDAGALVLMGIVLDAQKQFQNAESYYQRALRIAPSSEQVVNDFANHYLAEGDRSHARELYLRTVALDPQHVNANLQLAQMSVDDKQGQAAVAYLDKVKGSAALDPGALLLRARALGLCGRCSESKEVLQKLTGKKADAQFEYSMGMVLAECKYYRESEGEFSRAGVADPQNFEIQYNFGLAALRAGDPATARDAFQSALKIRPGDADSARALRQARTGLVLLLFYRQGAEAALQELNKTPEAERTSDDYLLRAQILDAQGKLPEAAAALNEGLRTAPSRAGLYYEAVDFLLKHKLYHEAEEFLEGALRARPDDRDLLLAQAITLNLLRRNADSERVLAQIQQKWPQWERVYLVEGMLLEMALKSAHARETLEKAIALGANIPEAYYYDALAITHAAPQDVEAAQNAIDHALALSDNDPYIYLLAGKIAMSRNDYSGAIQYLLKATELEPSLVPAHYELRHAYAALGDERKSQAEMETIKHIASETNGTDDSRFAVEDFLFAVRPPG
jgi:tetratricopeptide (TPR) repeat protein